MSHHFLNPNYKPHKDLGDDAPSFSDEEWDALKGKITAYLNENSSKPTLDVDACRALDPLFLNARVWAQAASEAGLFFYEIPDPE